MPEKPKPFAVQWLSTAATHSSTATDLIAGSSAVLSAAALVLGHFGVIENEASKVIAEWTGVGALIVLIGARLLLAPKWINEGRDKETADLKLRLDEFEGGPRFVIDSPQDQMAIAGGATNQGGDFSVVILPLRVTNEGQPGAALNWALSVELTHGEFVEAKAMFIAPGMVIEGGLSAAIPRGDLISERTAMTVPKGVTVPGYFFGKLPAGDHLKFNPETKLHVSCKDYRGRKATFVRVMGPNTGATSGFGISAPSLTYIGPPK
jgi:hypothetical protein